MEREHAHMIRGFPASQEAVKGLGRLDTAAQRLRQDLSRAQQQLAAAGRLIKGIESNSQINSTANNGRIPAM